jgi:hypothetical protein
VVQELEEEDVEASVVIEAVEASAVIVEDSEAEEEVSVEEEAVEALVVIEAVEASVAEADLAVAEEEEDINLNILIISS